MPEASQSHRLNLKAQLTSKGATIPIDTPTPELEAMLRALQDKAGGKAGK